MHYPILSIFLVGYIIRLQGQTGGCAIHSHPYHQHPPSVLCLCALSINMAVVVVWSLVGFILITKASWD